jgi:HlyD family secretion protein
VDAKIDDAKIKREHLITVDRDEPPLPIPAFAAESRARRTRRTVLWVVTLIVVAGLAVLGYSRRARAVPEIHYETVNADRGSIVAKVTATGNLSALLTVQVGSQVSGRLQQILVDYNSPVKKGQPIAKLDPLLFEAAAQQSRANYLTAQSNLKKAQAQAVDAQLKYQRAKQLLEAKVIAQSDLDTAQSNYEVAQAQVDAAQSDLEAAGAFMNQSQVNLGYTTIVSPIDGMVISRNVDVGQTVAASLQAPTLFVIAQDLRKMQVDTSVGEADVGKLTAGMSASFTVDAYSGQVFKGILRQIRNSPQTVQNVVTYDAVINVDNPSLLLKPGMTANVVFTAAEKDNVVRLRNTALRFQPDAQLLRQIGVAEPVQSTSAADPNHKTVWILRNGKPAPISVSVGISDGSLTELREGDVKPGDALIADMSGAAPRRGLF